MNKIIIIPSGVLSHKEIEMLLKADYIPLVCDEPEKIKLLQPDFLLSGSDLLLTALDAVANTSSVTTKERFINNLLLCLKKKD